MRTNRQITAMFFLGLWVILMIHQSISHVHYSHDQLHAFQVSHSHHHDHEHDHEAEQHNERDESDIHDCSSTRDAYNYHTHEYIHLEKSRSFKLNSVAKVWLSETRKPINHDLASQLFLRPPPNSKLTYDSLRLNPLTKRGPPNLV